LRSVSLNAAPQSGTEGYTASMRKSSRHAAGRHSASQLTKNK